MKQKTQFEKHPSPIKFERIGNEWYTSIRYKVSVRLKMSLTIRMT